MSTDILETILESTRRRLEAGTFAPVLTPPPRASEGSRFIASLWEAGTRIIAELKRRSPSSGEIYPSLEGAIETLALAYRRGHAAAISVVTESEHFGGSPSWVPRAKKISGLPVLMKDFFIDERQLDFAVSLGADAVLLIAAALTDEQLASLAQGARRRGLAVVAEAHDAGEVARAARAAPDALGVNARNLRTFAVDLARPEGLAAAIPDGIVRLAESGVAGRGDIERLEAAGYRAFLVGEAILRSGDPEECLRQLRGERR